MTMWREHACKKPSPYFERLGERRRRTYRLPRTWHALAGSMKLATGLIIAGRGLL
jgi:hypothetical protein